MALISILSLALTIGVITTKAALGVSAFNTLKQSIDLSNLGMYKNFDQPVADLLSQCLLLLARFIDYIQIIVAACAFLCIIFNAFKLWAGTVEIKKAYVDMVSKCVIVTALTLLWPSIITTTYKLASEIGIEASGGKNLITYSFASIAGHTKKIFKDGTAEYIKTLKEGADTTEDGKLIISSNALKAFTDLGMNENEAKSWLEQNGVTVDPEKKSWGFWIFSNNQKKLENKAKKSFINDNSYDVSTGKTKEQYIKQNIVVLRAMSEILTGLPENELGEVDISKILTMGDESLKSVFQNPFVAGSDNRLSISTMIKTSIILSKAFAEGSLASFDDFSKKSEEEQEEINEKLFNKYIENANLPMIVKLLGAILEYFVYHLGMIISTLLLMIEYSITVIEFFLVSAISTILIPLYFIDSTKQFVSNLIKMILTYFVKLVVTIMMCFFVMGMYLRMADSMWTRLFADANTLIYYAFVLVLGLILSKNSGKVASAVVSGNPSLGMGDLVNEFRGMSHLMHRAGRTLENGAKDLQKVSDKGKDAAKATAEYKGMERGIANGMEATRRNTTDRLNNLQKTAAAKQANGETLDKNEEAALAMSQAEINAAGDAAAENYDKTIGKNARKDFNKNQIFKALTGIDRRADSSSPLRLGQEFFDGETWRAATWDDVEKTGQKYESLGSNVTSDSAVKNNVDNYGRKKDTDLPEPGL